MARCIQFNERVDCRCASVTWDCTCCITLCFVKTSYFTQSAKIKRSNPTQGLSSHSLQTSCTAWVQFLSCASFFCALSVQLNFSCWCENQSAKFTWISHLCGCAAPMSGAWCISTVTLLLFTGITTHITTIFSVRRALSFLFLPIDRDEEISKYANILNNKKNIYFCYPMKCTFLKLGHFEFDLDTSVPLCSNLNLYSPYIW